MSNEEKHLEQTIATLTAEGSTLDPMAKFALTVLRRCREDGDNHWLADPRVITVPIPAALRSRYPKQATMQPRRILVAWTRPELIAECVTMTCGEKSCIRPSHCGGTGKEFKVPVKRDDRRTGTRSRNDPKSIARATRTFLDLSHHIGREDARALVAAALTLVALGIEPVDLLSGEV